MGELAKMQEPEKEREDEQKGIKNERRGKRMDENLISTILEVQKGSPEYRAIYEITERVGNNAPHWNPASGFYLYTLVFTRFTDFQSLLEPASPWDISNIIRGHLVIWTNRIS